MWSMHEVLGKLSAEGTNAGKLRRMHKISGAIYSALFVFIAYFCLRYIMLSKAEPSPRGIFHVVFAISVVLILSVKLTYIHLWKKYSSRVPIFGLLLVLITLGMAATSGGYYFLVTRMGTEKSFDEMYFRRMQKEAKPEAAAPAQIKISSDPALIARGGKIFQQTCSICHDASSTRTIVGPGLKGVLKRATLPVSSRPATPAGIRNQIRNPYKDMPRYDFLTDDDITALIAYLYTI